MHTHFFKNMSFYMILTASVVGNGFFTQDASAKNKVSQQEKTLPPSVQIQMHHLSFNDILEMTNDISSKLPNRPWRGILAVTRGGLVPAGILSQSMNIRRIEVINIKSYEEKTQTDMEILNKPHLEGEEENWIVLDDLSDSGKTLKYIRSLYPKAFYAALLVKPKGKDAPDLYSQEFPQDVWIHFPWEPLG